MRKLFSIATLLVAAASYVTAVPIKPGSDNVLVYLPGWAQVTDINSPKYFDISKVNLTGVTHAAYAFVQFYSDCIPFDGYGTRSGWGYDNLDLFVNTVRTRYPNIKILLSVGGGGWSLSAWKTCTSASMLNTFVDRLYAMMTKVNADGIDIDWELPQKVDTEQFTALFQALRTKLGPNKLVTAATTGSVSSYTLSDLGMNVSSIAPNLDFFNLMTYTLHDPCYWETQTAFHTAWTDCMAAVDWYKSKGAPSLKIMLGLAAYGHQYTLTDATRYTYPAPSVELRDCSNMKTPYYRTIMGYKNASQGMGGVLVDEYEKSAYYVQGTTWIGFDIEETLWMKITAAQDLGLGGVMLWDATIDTPSQDLLKAITSRTAPPVRSCGNGFIGNGLCVDPTHCCSEWGYCGVDKCGPGCRGGPCQQSPVPAPSPYIPGTCGGGQVGNGRCFNMNECCSKYGWCGATPDHCGALCVGGPCYSTTSPAPLPSPLPSPSVVSSPLPSPGLSPLVPSASPIPQASPVPNSPVPSASPAPSPSPAPAGSCPSSDWRCGSCMTQATSNPASAPLVGSCYNCLVATGSSGCTGCMTASQDPGVIQECTACAAAGLPGWACTGWCAAASTTPTQMTTCKNCLAAPGINTWYCQQCLTQAGSLGEDGSSQCTACVVATPGNAWACTGCLGKGSLAAATACFNCLKTVTGAAAPWTC